MLTNHYSDLITGNCIVRHNVKQSVNNLAFIQNSDVVRWEIVCMLRTISFTVLLLSVVSACMLHLWSVFKAS